MRFDSWLYIFDSRKIHIASGPYAVICGNNRKKKFFLGCWDNSSMDIGNGLIGILRKPEKSDKHIILEDDVFLDIFLYDWLEFREKPVLHLPVLIFEMTIE